MSEMLERLARILCRKSINSASSDWPMVSESLVDMTVERGWTAWESDAADVLEAMLEPTAAMVKAAHRSRPTLQEQRNSARGNHDEVYAAAWARKYRAMIEEALKPTTVEANGPTP